ncbi:hypothetical protein MKW98_006040 [Papaver atlanticum]|uniref:F-ATPase protein 6 n=1 Tax=Papaver atlanticum TaxID=357466 RepID=A0AAD4RU34_9MAGN|nr:hypothetical protein MKW98_006040 [Papaver atlanticum]
MKIGNLYFSFTNPSLSMLLTLSLVLLLVHFVTKNGGGNLVPNAWQSLVEQIYDFVLNLVNEQIGGLSGNAKQNFTVTSHFLVTLGLSFSIFVRITIVGFYRNGLHFLSYLLPAGVLLALSPFLILSGFSCIMQCINDLLFFIGDLGPLFIVLALTGLELGVAISQAYVSTILICIYLNDAIYLHQVSNFIYRPSTLICLFPSQ